MYAEVEESALPRSLLCTLPNCSVGRNSTMCAQMELVLPTRREHAERCGSEPAPAGVLFGTTEMFVSGHRRAHGETATRAGGCAARATRPPPRPSCSALVCLRRLGLRAALLQRLDRELVVHAISRLGIDLVGLGYQRPTVDIHPAEIDGDLARVQGRPGGGDGHAGGRILE
jgi:hypothetical protein